MRNKKINLLKKALAKETGLSGEQIFIHLSSSGLVAQAVTMTETFTILLSERTERCFERKAFALTPDGIESIKALKAKYIFFHSADCCRGILMGAFDDVKEYYDEFDDPIWIYFPLKHAKVYFKKKQL